MDAFLKRLSYRHQASKDTSWLWVLAPRAGTRRRYDEGSRGGVGDV